MIGNVQWAVKIRIAKYKCLCSVQSGRYTQPSVSNNKKLNLTTNIIQIRIDKLNI